MKSSRLAFYVIIALLCFACALQILIMEPGPGWPTNVVHLLVKH